MICILIQCCIHYYENLTKPSVTNIKVLNLTVYVQLLEMEKKLRCFTKMVRSYIRTQSINYKAAFSRREHKKYLEKLGVNPI